MSYQALNEAWLCREPDVTCRFVLVALADQANDDGMCWPAVDSIAMRTGLTSRSVQRALKKLVEGGHISFASHREGGRSITTRYLLHPVPCAARSAKNEARRARPIAGKGDGVSPIVSGKGDNDDIKGDGVSPIVSGKGDNDDIKGDFHDIKGDTVSPEPYKNHQGTKEEYTQGSLTAPVSEAEAWAFARNLPVNPPWTEQMVGHWFADRAFRRWETAGDNPRAITAANWREDLRRSHTWAQRAHPVAPPKPHGFGPVPAEKKIKAAPDARQAAVLEAFRRERPAFRGGFADIPVADRRRLLAGLSNPSEALTA